MIHTIEECEKTINNIKEMKENTKDPIALKALDKSEIKWMKYKREAEKNVKRTV